MVYILLFNICKVSEISLFEAEAKKTEENLKFSYYKDAKIKNLTIRRTVLELEQTSLCSFVRSLLRRRQKVKTVLKPYKYLRSIEERLCLFFLVSLLTAKLQVLGQDADICIHTRTYYSLQLTKCFSFFKQFEAVYYWYVFRFNVADV